MLIVIASISFLLALIVWKVWAIERRLTAMHLSWAKIMTPLAEGGRSELFTGGPEQHHAHKPRSVLDQIGIQVELATLEQREHRQDLRKEKDADRKEFGEYR